MGVEISNLTVEEFIAMCLVVVAVVTTAIKFFKTIYGWFLALYNKAKGKEKRENTLDEHTKQINEMKAQMKSDTCELSNRLENLSKIMKHQIRHMIVESCLRALNEEVIEADELSSIEEMYSGYHDVLGGNSYCTSLVKKVRNLDVVSKHIDK